MRLAVFTKPWPQDSVPDLARRVAGLGFDGAEVPVRPGFQVEVTTAEKKLGHLVSVFADKGVMVTSVASELDERVFASCATAGVKIIRIMAPILRGDYLRSEEKLRQQLEDAVPLCERYRVQVGVQQHYGDYVCDATGLRLLLDGTDRRWVGAIWDAAHDALAGLQPENGLDLVWERLLMVNLKNAYYRRINGPEAVQAEWTRHFTTGPHGLASWPRVLRELERRGYSGPLCMTAEYHDEAEVDRLCREDVRYVKCLLAERGGEAADG
jgi:sugar phosphate isomerase/epimerase